MRSFWTESQKKKEKIIFPLFCFLIKKGRGKKSLLPPPSFLTFPVRAPAFWGYLTIAIVLVNV